jgi:predicted MFS family arabinose efflux permease
LSDGCVNDGRGLERLGTLIAFFLASMVPEFLWSNFPPIMTLVEDKFRITATVASLPIILFSAGTVASAGMAGRMIDRRGYRHSTLFGLGMCAIFAGLRMVQGPFWLLAIAQGGIGAAFSFIAGAASSYVADWFEGRSAVLVSGLCVIGLYLGLGASMVVTPVLVERHGFSGTMTITAAASAAIFILGFPLLRQRRPAKPGDSRARLSRRELLRNRGLLLLFVISYLTGGLFSAVATGLEPIWALRGYSADEAGVANGLFVLGGVIGSLVMPLLLTWTRNAKAVLVICSLGILLLTYPLLVAPTLLVGNLIAVALGVFWMGNVPICYTMLERAAGTERAGAALSAFWAINSVGSVTLVWMFTALMQWTSWRVAAAVTLALLAVNQIVTVALPRDPQSSPRARDP